MGQTHQFRTMRIECEGETACHEEGVAGEENGVAEEENMASSVANLQHAVEAQIQWLCRKDDVQSQEDDGQSQGYAAQSPEDEDDLPKTSDT